MRIDLDNPHGESETVADSDITFVEIFDDTDDGMSSEEFHEAYMERRIALCMNNATVYLTQREFNSLEQTLRLQAAGYKPS